MITTPSPFLAIAPASFPSASATLAAPSFFVSTVPPAWSWSPYAAKSSVRSVTAVCCALSIITVRVR